MSRATHLSSPRLHRRFSGGALARLRASAFDNVDGASLAAFRVLFGVVVAVGGVRFLALGWIDILFAQPRVFLHHWAFPFVAPLSPSAMWGVEVILVILAVGIATGTFARWAFALFGLGFAWVQLTDVTNYLNHYYLVVWLCLLGVVLPTERVFSVDGWRARRRGKPLPQTVARYSVWLFRFQIALVYTFAAVAKAQPDWLLSGQPMGIWLAARSHYPLIGPLFSHGETALVMSWCGFLYDATVVWFLMWKPSRPFAYATVVFFHMMTAILFHIGLFPWIMVASTLLFFSPSWPRKVLERLRISDHDNAHSRSEPTREAAPGRHWSRLGSVVVIAFVAFHILMPLRFLLYPTPVLWGEEGMRWSWRVMVREKNAAVSFRVVSVATGRQWRMSPTAVLTWRQTNEAMTQPDLILQTAHLLAEQMHDRGHGVVRVYADATVSLNGRPPAPFIDGTIDLASVDDGVLPAKFILPPPRSPALSAIR